MRKHKFRAWDKKQKKWLGINLHMSVIVEYRWRCKVAAGVVDGRVVRVGGVELLLGTL